MKRILLRITVVGLVAIIGLFSRSPVHGISDESLLTLIQKNTFQYFWDGAEPGSGMAYERIHLDEVLDTQREVAVGGSGFGVMSILVGIERGFITREAGVERLTKIAGFLEKADRFHGAWPHWLYPNGKVKHFGENDDGGDVVETAYMVQGLIAVKNYLNQDAPVEKALADQITKLCNEVEWDWYQNGKQALYWHWSPTHNWEMNFAIEGYNECLIAYVLGASSPTHPLSPEAYHKCWARGGNINGKTTKYGYTLTLKHNGAEEYGGPLFWAHYSYLGLDPRNLKDRYAKYWDENRNQVMIDYNYCVQNKKNFKGYGTGGWGLTASYSVDGYSAHQPNNDLGVISPTAALSSFPYTPVQSMQAARYFYEKLGDKLWGKYGFYDAYSENATWFLQRYLAIDQGPIVVMIENYRSQLLWKLFMQDKDVQNGLKLLGFETAPPTVPPMSDDDLLTLIQKNTFQYFWDGAEPSSGMAYERIHFDEIYPPEEERQIAIGGSGFGVMAILVGIERGFIARQAGVERLAKIAEFLEKADRFHGAWPHWLQAVTGKVKPFGDKDDGGDIVETAYLIQGLIAVKNYLNQDVPVEKDLADKIEKLCNGVEWSWYQNGKPALYWHWSPTHNWEMNFAIEGYNECLIAYVLGASSPTFPLSPEAYHKCWARSGGINGNTTKYGYTLTLKHNGAEEYGGPLFWAHYSYLGLDPRNLKDRYANYWNENQNQVLIDYNYCVENPKKFKGYGPDSWGLTSSYSLDFYSGHQPNNDLGVISPTAALSSFPYSPEESLRAARYFYEKLGDKLWGKYGFYDAFSETANWFLPRYLAIDQGPIVVMIENYRSQLLWKLFMQDKDVQNGLTKLGFETGQSTTTTTQKPGGGSATLFPSLMVFVIASIAALLA